MNTKLTTGNYVKFVRTTATVWDKLLDSQKDTDTLYFVLQTDNSAGDLYLGPVLISSVNQSFTISDLQDVLPYDASELEEGSMLVWNTANEQWQAKSILEVFEDITSQIGVMTGATETTDGLSGLVPVPSAGEQNKFLAGSGEWKNPLVGVPTIVNNILTGVLGEDDWETDENDEYIGPTIREIVTGEIAKVIADAPEDYDTLKEIADWIISQPTIGNIAELSNRVDDIDDDVAELKTIVIEGTGELPSLVSQVATLNSTMTTVQNNITDIQNILKWQNMSEDI